MATVEGKLPDFAEAAFAEGKPWIVAGQVYLQRADVPEKWFTRGQTVEAEEQQENAARLREAAGRRKSVLEKKSVEALRQTARELRVPSEGTKADLVARIQAAEGLAPPPAAETTTTPTTAPAAKGTEG